ncbi:hypothetical protein ACMBCN_01285, partial [Candidatus Liberibacter asiaticus]|nr:hypothetical protein [Candidatus Liberibacter asiaticus]
LSESEEKYLFDVRNKRDSKKKKFGRCPLTTPQPTHRGVGSAKNWVLIYSTFNNPSSDTMIINLC